MVGTGTLALSLGLGLFTGQLVAPQAASAAAPVVTAAAAAGRVLPKLSQSVNRRVLAKGQSVTLTVKITNSKTGKAVNSGRVQLQAYRKGWKTWQTRHVRAGKVTFVSKPSVTGSYRSVFLGTGGVRYGVSSSVKVTVKPNASAIIAEARKHVGALYLYGASGPKRFDCSGFTMYVYKKATGRKLPHKANSQQKYGKAVSKKNKQVGDLIVVRSGSYGYHVGIYAGNNTWYDSPRSGKRVSKRKIFSSNYVVRRLI
jgi:cell wall-associated NlpC family hydrolase